MSGQPVQLSVVLLFCSVSVIHSRRIPWIRNVSLVPLSPTNITTLLNRTCDQCLCSAWRLNSTAFNCFLSNGTCQLFDPFPRSYRVDSTSNTGLYFSQGVLPNDSVSLAADLKELLTKLSNATMTSVSVTKPRCLAVDNHGYLVTVEENGNRLTRVDPRNMTLVDRTNISGATFQNIAYHQQAYFISRNDQSVLIVNSNNLTVINTITNLLINGPRDIIFLRNGQTMILASTYNKTLLFFNLTNNATRQYTYASKINTGYSTPHGLWYVNDSLFYATSWGENLIYSYSTINGVSWTGNLFNNASSLVSGGVGSHITVDSYQRTWFSMYTQGIRVFNSQGQLIGNFTPALNSTFDLVFMNNYVMYISDNTGGRVVRIDPNING